MWSVGRCASFSLHIKHKEPVGFGLNGGYSTIHSNFLSITGGVFYSHQLELLDKNTRI